MQAQFENEFKALRDLGTSKFSLRGPTILVEVMPAEELKTASGLIIPAPKQQGDSVNAHKLEHGIVLMVGQGTWDDDKREHVPLDILPGQVVVMPQYSQQVISTFPGLQKPLQNRLALVSASAILGTYKDAETFEEAKRAINQNL